MLAHREPKRVRIVEPRQSAAAGSGPSPGGPLSRRSLLRLTAGVAAACAGGFRQGSVKASEDNLNLSNIPVELIGSWEGTPKDAAQAVILHARAACLRGIGLLSDRQPKRLRVENRSSGPPHIWLHSDLTTTAWVVVDIDPLDWSKLAYQFGHELGHVMANSWNVAAWPEPPCQWLEESLVEAFSIRGLALLADDWAHDPPFPGDGPFSRWIRDYRNQVVSGYARAGNGDAGLTIADWFRAHRAEIERSSGLQDIQGPCILALVLEYENDKGCVEDIGALNRWPERTRLPIDQYLAKWRASCQEIKAPGRLPERIATLLGLEGAPQQ